MFTPGNSALLIVDVQGRLAELMHEKQTLYRHIVIMIKAAKIMQMPIFWLEQYPQGLGHTQAVIRDHLSNLNPIEKSSFSACGSTVFCEALSASGRTELIVTGIETHVCVYQTVLDLLQKKYKVAVNEQAVSSRILSNKSLGLKRMQQAGALLSSTEMILFELMRSAKYPHFKSISQLLK